MRVVHNGKPKRSFMLAGMIKLSLLSILIFAALGTAARVLGAGEPLNPALAGFITGCEDKPQPCWYGIIPGVTLGDDVGGLIAFAGRGRYAYDDLVQSYTIYFTPPETTPACVFTFRTDSYVVTRVEISLCSRSDVRMGDLFTIWNPMQQSISLPPHSLVSGSFSFNLNGWPTPTSPVYYINLLAQPDTLAQFPWHGFIPLWRYCQFEPAYPQCR